MPDQYKDPLYVGYLPLPSAIKRFLIPWLAGNFVLAIGIAAVVASQDRDPGDGVWDTGQAVEIVGNLSTMPYPLLRAEDKTYILVEQGKIGLQQRLAEQKIQPGLVTARGYVIEREGRCVFELDGTSQDALVPFHTDSGRDQARIPSQYKSLMAPPSYEHYGTYTLRGEIVDPKCYLGVMQPGDGKTHKVCATLCIKGGIPPMFLVRGEDGKTAAYLLTDADGNAIPESVYPYIADPIELTGQIFRLRETLYMMADLDSIRRISKGD